MPNTVQAAAEGMPKLTRRTALAMSSAGIVSAITILSTTRSTPASAGVDSSLAALDGLIARFAAAYERDEMLWAAVSKLDSKLDDGLDRPIARVQVGRVYCGRDDSGVGIFNPIWGYCEADIDKYQEPSLRAALSTWCRTDGDEHRIRAKFAAFANKKKAELAEVLAEAKRVEDEAGYTAAHAAATASASVVSSLKDQIVSFRPETPAAVVRLAEWAASAADIHLEQRDLVNVLSGISASATV